MSDILSGLLRVAGAGVAGYGEDRDEAVRVALANAAADRQARQDAINNAIANRRLGILERNAGNQSVEYRPDSNGNLIALPKKLPIAATGAQASAPSPSMPPVPSTGPAAPQVPGVGTRTGITVHQPGMLRRAVTGVIEPGKPPVRGTVGQDGTFAPDTTAQGDTVYAPPRATPGNRTTPGADLNHTINNVGAQIEETQRQLNAAKRAVAAGNDRFALPNVKQAGVAAGISAQKLQQRLDSLTTVHDLLNARQQSSMGVHAGIADSGMQPPAAPRRQPARAPLPGPRTEPPVSTGMSRAQAVQMQQEFDDASGSLKAVLNSAAPDAVKARAQQLYQQTQAEIAKKYGTLQQP